MSLITHSLLFAQALGDLQSKLGEALKLIMMFGFLYGVICVMAGATAIRRGEDGKSSIIAGILIAAAPAILWALYEVFLGGGIAPKF